MQDCHILAPASLLSAKQNSHKDTGMGSGMESKLKQQWPRAPGRAVGVPPRAGG